MSNRDYPDSSQERFPRKLSLRILYVVPMSVPRNNPCKYFLERFRCDMPKKDVQDSFPKVIPTCFSNLACRDKFTSRLPKYIHKRHLQGGFPKGRAICIPEMACQKTIPREIAIVVFRHVFPRNAPNIVSQHNCQENCRESSSREFLT